MASSLLQIRSTVHETCASIHLHPLYIYSMFLVHCRTHLNADLPSSLEPFSDSFSILVKGLQAPVLSHGPNGPNGLFRFVSVPIILSPIGLIHHSSIAVEGLVALVTKLVRGVYILCKHSASLFSRTPCQNGKRIVSAFNNSF